MQKQALQPELTTPSVTCPPDNLPIMDEPGNITRGQKLIRKLAGWTCPLL